ncbi:hypothetical protein [uncultured Microbacterium sp.]|uniref:hypothetical protein n=1 Tax=uncultured Microbacterium sp. TaxID=191216 RepID=UPI0025CE406D|nr:hypothetical protein [uncultured Microbacterium sp.]
MSGTVRAVAIPGKPVHTAAESHRVRTEREERIARQARAAKRFDRVDRYAERRGAGEAA